MQGSLKEISDRLTGEERREQIIMTSRKLFAEKGYSGTTTQEIADAADISTTLIFQHFATKEKLFEAVIEASYGKENLREELLDWLQSDGDSEICRQIAEHNFGFANTSDGREIMRLLTYISLEKPSLYQKHLIEEGADVLELVTSYFTKRIDDGTFKPVNPIVAARAFLGMIRNYLWNYNILGEPSKHDFPDSEVIDTFVTVFLDGMRR